MTYRESERLRAIQILTEVCRDPGNGVFLEKPREFVLSERGLNLWEGIREDALAYFQQNKISWWNGEEDGPTGHMLSSQVACVNHLFLVRFREDLALALLRSIEPRVRRAELIDDGYVAFEFVGSISYLNEGRLTRGANCTSVDAAMLGTLESGERCLFLIEWKYTEEYPSKNLYGGPDGATRKLRYDALIMQQDSPFANKLPEIYYYEPFYQLMRQTLLGWLMAGKGELECSQYRHVHVVPEANKEINRITSPTLKTVPKKTLAEVWRALLVHPSLFISTSPEKLLSSLLAQKGVLSPLTYLKKRYW